MSKNDIVAGPGTRIGGDHRATYPALMVHLDMGPTHAGLLQLTADLAERFQSGVIGITACQPKEAIADAYAFRDVIQRDRDDIDKCMQTSEAEFYAALRGRAKWLEWRAVVTTQPLSKAIAHQSRGADLLVTGLGPGPASEGNRRVDLGKLVVQVGRPILLVPQEADEVKMERVLVGWNDTREVRRAISDALPILGQARHVSVLAIVDDADAGSARAQVSEVVVWLERHGIAARPIISPSSGNDAARLTSVADDEGTDLIVAGAYGHSRVREWALGGVTRHLLLHGTRCTFFSN